MAGVAAAALAGSCAWAAVLAHAGRTDTCNVTSRAGTLHFQGAVCGERNVMGGLLERDERRYPALYGFKP
jgi:hypothetical protein